MDESSQTKSELAQIVRLALAEQNEDVRLYVARLVRLYRKTDPEFSSLLDSFLQLKSGSNNRILRKENPNHQIPVDDDSKLFLLKKFRDDPSYGAPILSSQLNETLNQLIQERKKSKMLISMGLAPSRSAIFVGPPGVGKTLTARWLAAKLEVPLYVLDLTAVMSSLLGKSGNNLRSALDFAKREPCVLLLDEIDAIAKRRNDDTDIGELKRLVTVILQEVDEWPSTGLLLAATNHPELIDHALWRRFDMIIEFKKPDLEATKAAIHRFLGQDYKVFEKWVDALVLIFKGESFSEIERVIQRFRRAIALKVSTVEELIGDLIRLRASNLEGQEKRMLASELAAHTELSQHTISEITGVSRDTIRKYNNRKLEKGKAENESN